MLIAGGQGKGQDFIPLRNAVTEHCRAVVLMGEDATRLQTVLADTVPLITVSSMNEAVTEAAKLAQADDAVLLSPACASFDMFNDYVQRGEQYILAVEAMPA